MAKNAKAIHLSVCPEKVTEFFHFLGRQGLAGGLGTPRDRKAKIDDVLQMDFHGNGAKPEWGLESLEGKIISNALLLQHQRQ